MRQMPNLCSKAAWILPVTVQSSNGQTGHDDASANGLTEKCDLTQFVAVESDFVESGQ
jgi:hypothetical protein